MLIPSTITARRTHRYTSTWYIHPTTHKHDFEPMDGRGRYIFQPPQCQAVNPSRWSTLPPPCTGGLHLNKGNLEEALQHYDRSLDLNSCQKASFANRAVTFTRMKKYDEAIRDFSRVIALDRHDARAHWERGQVYWDSVQPELAEKDFTEAIRLDERMEDAYIGRATCHAHRGDFDGVVQDMNVVIDLNPENSVAYRGRGVALAATGNIKPALLDLSSAIEMDPTDSAAYMGRSFLRFNVGEYQDAITDLGKYLDVGGDDPSAAHFRRGIAHVALGNFEEARGEMQVVLGQDPSVAGRVVASISDVVDGSESSILPDDVPADIQEMMEPPGWC